MKKTYINKSLSVLLVMIIIITTYAPVYAEYDSTYKLSSGLNSYFETGYHDELVDHTLSRHITFVESMRDSMAMDVLGFIYKTGAEPDQSKYMEVLINIMKLYETANASTISEQHKRDNLKAIEDYSLDVLDIGVSLIPSMKNTSESTKQLGEWIKIAIGGLNAMIGSTTDWIDGISDLQTQIQNYAKHDQFLSLIADNADGELKKAATTLKSSLANAMKIKLEKYAEISNDNFYNYSEFFFEDVFFEALKTTDLYEDDNGFRGFVDIGSNVFSLFTAIRVGEKIGSFVANVVIGVENVINRVLEMKAIYAISEVLEKELTYIKNSFSHSYSDETDKIAQDYITYSNYLINSRIRGEYCLYSMLAKDAGLYSYFGEETSKAAETRYNQLTTKLLGVKQKLEIITDVLLVDFGSSTEYEAVNQYSEWHVYDVNGQLYDDYTLRIYDKRNLLETVLLYEVNDIDHTVTEHIINSAKPLSLTLEKGCAYTFEFVDNQDKTKSKIMTVGVTTGDPILTSIVEVKGEFGTVKKQLTYDNIVEFEEMLCETSTVWGISDGFDSDKTDLSHFTTHSHLMLDNLLGYYFNEDKHAQSVSDPKGLFPNYGTVGYELSKVQWVMKTIFNISVSNDASGDNFYIDSSILHVKFLAMGWAPYIEYKVLEVKKIDGNKYAIKVESTWKMFSKDGEITDIEIYSYIIEPNSENGIAYLTINKFVKNEMYFDSLIGDNIVFKEP